MQIQLGRWERVINTILESKKQTLQIDTKIEIIGFSKKKKKNTSFLPQKKSTDHASCQLTLLWTSPHHT